MSKLNGPIKRDVFLLWICFFGFLVDLGHLIPNFYFVFVGSESGGGWKVS
jgi:hypothetical protein